MTDEQNVKVDIIEILNNAKDLDSVKFFCEEVTQKNVTIIKLTDIVELLNRQKAEIERFREFVNSGGKNFKNMFCNAKIIPISEIHFKTEKETKSEAIKKYQKDLLERAKKHQGNVFGVPLIIAEIEKEVITNDRK